MFLFLRKFIFIITFNSSLFIFLMVGIQNSSYRNKVDLLFAETIELPISFILGISFITGSLTGSFLKINPNNKKDYL